MPTVDWIEDVGATKILLWFELTNFLSRYSFWITLFKSLDTCNFYNKPLDLLLVSTREANLTFFSLDELIKLHTYIVKVCLFQVNTLSCYIRGIISSFLWGTRIISIFDLHFQTVLSACNLMVFKLRYMSSWC